jgi:hypothetical protein
MKNVLLISEEVLKTYTAINENVQSDELRFCILQAQNIFIQESLGTNLFNYMLDIVGNNTIYDANNLNYKELLDTYIQPTLISYSYYLGLDNFAFKWMSVGLVQNRSEQGSPVDFKMFQYMKSTAKNQAEFNDNLLRRHLIFRSALYPQYFSGNINDGQLEPEVNQPFKSSITLPSNAWGYGGKKLGKGNFNLYGPLCCGNSFPSWYGSASN